MLLTYILPFINLNKINNKLLLFQNIYLLFIVIYSLISIYDYRNTYNTLSLLDTTKYLRIFLLFDLLLCENELIIHHLASLCITQIALNNNILFFNTNVVFYTSILYGTELSTLFLCIKSILLQQFNENIIYIDLLFLGTFIYTRIYLFSKYLIFEKSLYYIFSEQLTKSASIFYIFNDNICINISLYTLYFLNIYWFLIITKKTIKPFIKVINLYSLYYEKFLKYTYFLSLFGSLYLYKPYQNILFAIDIIGQGILCITSYNYHKSLELKLAKGIPEDKINVLENHIIWNYLNDIICINIRCFGCILVHTNLFISYNLKNIAYAIISIIVHLTSLYHYINFIITLKINGDTFYLIDKDSYKNNIINLFSGLPILIDTLICLTNTDFYVKTNLIIITFVIFAFNYIRPFYNASFLILHFLLFIQTIALCQSNIVSNM